MLILSQFRVTDPEDSRETERRIQKAHAAFLAELAENRKKREMPGYMGYEWVGTATQRREWHQISQIVSGSLSRHNRDRKDRF